MLYGLLSFEKRVSRKKRSIDPLSVPGIVPGFLAIIILILAVLLLVRSVRRRGYRLARQDAATRAVVFSPATFRVVLCLFLALVYALGLVGNLPFWLATFLFVTTFILVFEWPLAAPARRWLTVATGVLQGVLVAAAVTLWTGWQYFTKARQKMSQI